MLKKFNIPDPKFSTTISNDIQKYLDKIYARHQKDGNSITLAGAYKYIRKMTVFALLGDYVILAQCVRWFRRNSINITRQQIRRCLNYFEDYDMAKIRLARDLTNQLFESAPAPPIPYKDCG